MAFRKLVGSYKDYNIASHIIEKGYLAVDVDSGSLRIGDGVTAGGTEIASSGGGGGGGSASSLGDLSATGSTLSAPSNGDLTLTTAGTGSVIVDDTFKIGSGASVTTILDEDDMSSDSATALVTQQSIKKYVDDQVTAQDLDVTTDSGTIDIDLDSETLSISGTSNEIETSATGTAVTIGLPDDVTIADDLTVTGDIASVTNIKATGIATITGAIDGDNTLDIAKQVSFASSLTVAGLSTFTGAIDANGGATIDNIQIGITGDNEIDTVSGNLTIDSADGTTTIDDILSVTGKSTLTKEVGISSALSVAGVSTFVGITSFTSLADFDGGIAVTTAIVEDLTAGRVVTVKSDKSLEDSGNLTFDGSTLLVTGTLNSTVDVQINGTSVADSALNDAVAMAIALG